MKASKHLYGLFWIPRVMIIALAYTIWTIFWPGLMSPDSISQYEQAINFSFSTWHPPLMSFVLSILVYLGSGISDLIFFQVILGITGIYFLFIQACQLNENSTSTRSLKVEFLAVIFTLILCSPLSPTIFYLVTFWKDAWTAFSAIWISSLYLSLIKKSHAGTYKWYLLIVLLTLAIGTFILSRHNSVALAPILTIFITIPINRRYNLSKQKNLAVYFLSVILLIALPQLFNRALNSEEEHPENSLMALELLSVQSLDSTTIEQMPYTNANIILENWQDSFILGNIRSINGRYRVRPLKRTYLTRAKNLELQHEYLKLLKLEPLTLFKVKFFAFKKLLIEQLHPYCSEIAENSFNLVSNTKYKPERESIVFTFNKIYAGSLGILFSRHLIWFFLIVLLLCKKMLSAQVKLNSETLILLFALSLYLVYLLASIATDYRYLFPASLLAQVFISARFIKWIATTLTQRRI